MRIELDTSKDAKENASTYFEKAKKAKERLKGAATALLQSKKELEALEKEEKNEEGKEKKEEYKIKRKKEWYEQFHFFFTRSGRLVIAGRSAKQNDLIYSKYLEEGDLFFHADIQGAPATVLKKGKNEVESGQSAAREGRKEGGSGVEGGREAENAGDDLQRGLSAPEGAVSASSLQRFENRSSPREARGICVKRFSNEAGTREGESREEKELVAQFSASYSSAWKVGAAAVDVYAVKKGQLSKHASGGFVGKGGFAIEGEREWFRKTPLGMKVFVREGVPFAVPERMQIKEKSVVLEVGGKDEKVKAAKKIAKLLSCELDELMQLLPSGGMRVVWGS